MRASVKVPPSFVSVDLALPTRSHPTIFDLTDPFFGITFAGFSGVEPEGRWSDGHHAELSIPIRMIRTDAPIFLLSFDLRCFLANGAVSQQRVSVFVNELPQAEWNLRHDGFRRHVIGLSRASLEDSATLTIRFEFSEPAQPSAFGLNTDERWLGFMLRRLIIEGTDKMPAPDSLFWHYGRHIGGEADKSFDSRIESGFWTRFVRGPDILDIRYRGYQNDVLPIFEGATGLDIDDPDYDGTRLPFADESHDTVFANFCLPYIPSYINAIQDWHRVTRVGGRIIIVVPSAALYEKKIRPPSRRDHFPHRFYSPSSLLAEIESALSPNTYRVRCLEEDDTGYLYTGAVDAKPGGRYELITILEKITPPKWTPEP